MAPGRALLCKNGSHVSLPGMILPSFPQVFSCELTPPPILSENVENLFSDKTWRIHPFFYMHPYCRLIVLHLIHKRPTLFSFLKYTPFLQIHGGWLPKTPPFLTIPWTMPCLQQKIPSFSMELQTSMVFLYENAVPGKMA